jgi:UDP-N-acetylmuramoyl-tripeptide--D-alanyl-D-alanine ligase
LLQVPGGPTFLIDTAKAPWETIELPMQTVASADAPRKRIVIGHISDYPGNPVPKYRSAYQAARAVADQVIFVGDNAHRHRASQQDRDEGRIIEATSVRDVYDHLRETAIPDELILLKSSRNLHLERVALAFTHDVKCWVAACGLPGTCGQCGLYEIPFEEHEAIKKKQKRERRRQRSPSSRPEPERGR